MLLVMDYMEGGPVMTREALERGRCIPESLACQYFRDMCKASLLSDITCHLTVSMLGLAGWPQLRQNAATLFYSVSCVEGLDKVCNFPAAIAAC